MSLTDCLSRCSIISTNQTYDEVVNTTSFDDPGWPVTPVIRSQYFSKCQKWCKVEVCESSLSLAYYKCDEIPDLAASTRCHWTSWHCQREDDLIKQTKATRDQMEPI